MTPDAVARARLHSRYGAPWLVRYAGDGFVAHSDGILFVLTKEGDRQAEAPRSLVEKTIVEALEGRAVRTSLVEVSDLRRHMGEASWDPDPQVYEPDRLARVHGYPFNLAAVARGLECVPDGGTCRVDLVSAEAIGSKPAPRGARALRIVGPEWFVVVMGITPGYLANRTVKFHRSAGAA